MLAVVAGFAAAPWTAAAEDGGGDDDSPSTPGAVGTPVLMGGGAAFDGTFVDGDLPTEGAVVLNFTRQGVTLFARVAVSGYERHEVAVDGGRVVAAGDGVKLEVVDALAGYLEVEMGAGHAVSFVPAGGVELTQAGGSAVDVRVGGVSGLIFADCVGTVLVMEGGEARLAASAEGCEVFFRAATGVDVLPFADLDDALAEGNLGAEVSLGGAAAGGTEVSLVSYSGVDANATFRDERLSLALAAVQPEGKSVLVLLPRGWLDAGDNVGATMDGAPVARAASHEDALNASDDGGAAEYFVESAGNLTALVVSVPHFSVHLFEFAVAGPITAPLKGVPLGEAAVPLVLGAAVAAGAGAALWRRPRDED